MEFTEYLDRLTKSDDVQELLKIADEAIEDVSLTTVQKMHIFQASIHKSNLLQGDSCPLRTNAG